MFGQCCFDVGDVKCTMGTASFIDINTGKYPHASVAGNSLSYAFRKGIKSYSTADVFFRPWKFVKN